MMMNEADDAMWEVIAAASGMTQASIIVGRLASEGICTQLRYEAAGSIYAITIDGLGEVRILVAAADRDQAREILSRSYDEGDLDWGNETSDALS
jgi:hypothetical protein